MSSIRPRRWWSNFWLAPQGSIFWPPAVSRSARTASASTACHRWRARPRRRCSLRAEALSFPAVQLFVERASAIVDGFELTDADAPILSDICRKLGGIALAIELAAGRIDAFGIQQLSTLLDDRFRVLRRGKRTAQPRHQSLAATLDWSYEFLPESECAVLRRLSLFASAFTLESAMAVAEQADTDVIESIANLVAKSLVSAGCRDRR